MKIALLLIILLTNFSISADNESKYVCAKKGLFVREKPNINSKIITKLAFGTKVSTDEKSNEKYEYHDNLNNKDYSDYWYKIKYYDKEGWIYGGFLNSFEELKRILISDILNDKNNIEDNYKHLAEDKNIKIDYIWFHPGDQMAAAEMYFFKNGLLVLFSELYSQKKDIKYFKYQFNEDKSELKIQLIDKRINFDLIYRIEKRNKGVVNIDKTNKSITYKIVTNSSNPPMKAIFFETYGFFEKDL